jgi:hypothetical protein
MIDRRVPIAASGASTNRLRLLLVNQVLARRGSATPAPTELTRLPGRRSLHRSVERDGEQRSSAMREEHGADISEAPVMAPPRGRALYGHVELAR